MRILRADAGVLVFSLLLPLSSAADDSQADGRREGLRHLDLPYTFPTYRTLAEWQARAAHLREHLRASTGLLPEPPRGDLRAQVFGRTDHGEYTVEKVYFESLPGVYVTGNLYRPKGASGRRPAVLNPHGHWTWGRLENAPLGSGPRRALTLARQGYVAFAWDMVGFGDNTAIAHDFGGPREALWGLSLMGLQTWNSLRAVDFVSSLPDVDPNRIGCTGESGGGTQTFMLSALDERVQAAAPVNMISAHMQGGCLCENAPNLRIDTHNVEIAALMAPRPLFMVAATGDWTKDTPTVEYPAVLGVYGLFGAADRVRTVQFDAPHNYDQRSREAVYGFLAHALLGRTSLDPMAESDAPVPSLSELLVFYGRPRPPGEKDAAALGSWWREMAREQIEAALPRDARSLRHFRDSFGVALRHALQASLPGPGEVLAAPAPGKGAGGSDGVLAHLSRRGDADRVPATTWRPEGSPAPGSWAIVASVPASGAELPPGRTPLVEALRGAGYGVVSVSLSPARPAPPPAIQYFNTYNRTDAAHRVQDVLTAASYVRALPGLTSLSVIGVGAAGLPVLLARALTPPVDRYVVDADGFDNGDDEAFLRELSIPGLRRAGDFVTAALADLDSDLLIHDTRGRFQTHRAALSWRDLGRDAGFQAEAEGASDGRLVEWLKNRR